MAIKVSASTLYRAAACPGSAVLPQIREESSEVAAKGTAIHKFLENCLILNSREEALRLVPAEYFDACSVIDVGALPASNKDSWHPEVSFAYNWLTGRARILGIGKDRDYGELDPNEIPGTTDIIGLTESAAIIWDYKTGRGHLEPAEANWQLKILGVAAAAAYDKEEAHVGLIRVWDSINHFEPAHYDVFALSKAFAEIKAVMLRVKQAEKDVEEGKVPKLTVGGHCTFCKAFRVCPAQMGLIRMSYENPGKLRFNPVEVTIEQLGSAWNKIQAIRSAIDIMEENIREVAKSQPVPLGNGKVLAQVEVPRESPTDPHIVESVIKELYGAEAASEAVLVKISATKESVKNTVRKHMPPGAPVGKTVEAAFQALRDAGGMETRLTFQVREITPKNITVGDDGALRRELPEGT